MYPYRLWFWKDCPMNLIRANPPARMSADSRLRDSLRAEGMLNPIVCNYHYINDETTKVLVGIRRFHFWRELGHNTIDMVLVSYDPKKEFPCEELALTAEAVEAKFAPGWVRLELGEWGLKMHMKSNEFQF